MTGSIFDIKKFAVHDGPGIRTTVFFKGCPLNCLWCHNPESRNINCMKVEDHGSDLNGKDTGRYKNSINGTELGATELVREIKKDELFYEQSGGGVTFSGGEPLMQADFLAEVLKLCRENKFHTAVDSSGYTDFSEFEKLSGLVDLYLFDLKLMDDTRHLKYVGVSNEKILDNLIRLDKAGEQIDIRIPLIPEITDTKENLTAILDFIRPLSSIRSVTVLPFNRLAIDKYRRYNISSGISDLKTQPDDQLNQMAGLFSNAGYRAQIGG